MLKLAKLLPEADAPVEVPPLVVAPPLLPPPPQAAAINATPAENAAAVASRFHGTLRFNSLPPRLDSRRGKTPTPLRAPPFLLTSGNNSSAASRSVRRETAAGEGRTWGRFAARSVFLCGGAPGAARPLRSWRTRSASSYQPNASPAAQRPAS